MMPLLANIPAGLTAALVLSAFLLGLCVACSRLPWALAAFGFFCGGGLLAFFWLAVFTMSPVVAWIWGTLFFVTVIAASMEWAPKLTAVCGVAAIAIVYIVAAVAFIPEYRERLALRAEYPQESLAERLAYEGPHVTATSNSEIDGQLPGDLPESYVTRIEKRLFDADERNHPARMYNWDARTKSLSALYRPSFADMHLGFVHEFITADGFGVLRMGPLPAKRKYIEIPVPQPIPLPEPSAEPEPTGQFAEENPAAPPLHPAVAEEFHVAEMADFVNKEGFGYVPYTWKNGESVKRLDRVVGFQPHAFRRLPEPLPVGEAVRWVIDDLELVSLLKQDTPRVYLSENMPRMDELRNAPTRPLDEFEADALGRLRNGETLVLHEDHNELRMFGPLVAVERCLECHNVNRGDLLGAFTYRLHRDPKLPPREHSVSWLR